MTRRMVRNATRPLRLHAIRPAMDPFSIGWLCAHSGGAGTVAGIPLKRAVAGRVRCVAVRPSHPSDPASGVARGEPMSLDVSPALLEQAERGEVDEAAFVDCVRNSLPY